MKLGCECLQICNTEQPICKYRNEDIEENEGKDDAKVAPSVAVRYGYVPPAALA
jgi:hypothetical protein